MELELKNTQKSIDNKSESLFDRSAVVESLFFIVALKITKKRVDEFFDFLDERDFHDSSFNSRISTVIPFMIIHIIAGSIDKIINLVFFDRIVVERKVQQKTLSTELLKIASFFYSLKTTKNVFEPITADWQEEYFEALFKKEIWKARWINIRYTYAFIVSMWQKSPIGDLLEFISKIAK